MEATTTVRTDVHTGCMCFCACFERHLCVHACLFVQCVCYVELTYFCHYGSVQLGASTALHCAAVFGHVEVVALLLERGANIEAKEGRVSCLALLYYAWLLCLLFISY